MRTRHSREEASPLELVGRQQEAEDLRALLDGRDRPPGSLEIVTVEGPVGIGKSALAASVLGRLDARVFSFHGDRTAGSGPLESQRAMIETLLEAHLEDLLEQTTSRALAARCAGALGEDHVVLLVEDAHRLDPATEDFLVTLLGSPTAAPLTLVVLHRTEHEPHALVRAARRRGAGHEHLTLGPLSDAAVARLTAHLTADQAASAIRHAEGNPLFVRTALAAFRRHPEVSDLAEVLELEGRSRSALAGAAAGADVDALPDVTRRVLEVLTVLGAHHRPGALLTLADQEEPVVAAQLETLRAHGLIDHDHVVHPGGALGVRQQRDPAGGVALHRSAAGLDGADLLTRAGHLAQVGSSMTSAEAETVLAAARLLIDSETATPLRLLTALPERHQTPASQGLTARAQIKAGDFHDTIDLLRPLVEDHPELQEPRILLSTALRMSNQLDEARAVLLATRTPDDPDDLRELIEVLALIDGRVPGSLLDRLRRSTEVEHHRVADVYDTLGLLAAGRVAEARETFRSVPGWVAAAAPRTLRSCIHAVANAVWCAYMLDEYETAVAIAHRGESTAHRFGHTVLAPTLDAGRAFALIQLGEIDEAEAAAERALQHASRQDAPELIAMARGALVVCALARGDLETTRLRHGDLAAAQLPRLSWWRYTTLAIRVRASAFIGVPEPWTPLLGAPEDALSGMRHADIALAAAREGAASVAERHLDEGLAVARRQRADGQEALLLMTRAHLAVETGDLRRLRTAEPLLERARAIFQDRGMGLQLGRVEALSTRLTAEVSRRLDPRERLTRREQEVAQLLVRGSSNREIAEELVISGRTAEDHVSRILRKLQVPSRAAAVALLASYDA